MTEKAGKNVFIIGNSASGYSLAEKFCSLEEVEKIFIASGNDASAEFCTVVDIREDSIQELLEFSLENAIDLTVVVSEKAIKNDIASVFQNNGQMIFAPGAESADICLKKSFGKKFMYKNRIPCPKFGIFDKPAMAFDYLKKSQTPLVIKTDEHQSDGGSIVCSEPNIAKTCVENLFESGEKRIIIEDYIYGHEFSFYVITDGYKALPLGVAATYKYEDEGKSGQITGGMGAFVPDYRVSNHLEQKILKQIVYPTLNSLSSNQTPYIGILGIDCILTPNDELYVIEFNSFLQSPECQCILALLDENIYKLIEACTIGSFADDYEKIDISDSYAASCVLSSKRRSDGVISGLDDLDDTTSIAHFNTRKNTYLEYETAGGRTLVLTKCAKTLSRAIENLYEEVSIINFDGMKFRKDIGKIL